MIAELEDIKAFLAGETEGELLVKHEPPPRGRVAAVQPKPGKRAKCYVRIEDSWPHVDGGYVVRCEVTPTPHKPRLLRPARAGEDYTSSPSFALSSGHEPEPEAVSEEWEDAFGLNAQQSNVLRNAQLRRDWEDESIISRIEAEIQEAERLGINPAREMARLEAGLAALKRRNAIEKQQRRKAA